MHTKPDKIQEVRDKEASVPFWFWNWALSDVKVLISCPFPCFSLLPWQGEKASKQHFLLMCKEAWWGHERRTALIPPISYPGAWGIFSPYQALITEEKSWKKNAGRNWVQPFKARVQRLHLLMLHFHKITQISSSHQLKILGKAQKAQSHSHTNSCISVLTL